MRVLSIGEILWDIYPDRQMLGGAPFNFATFVHRLGDASALLTGLGNDDRGKAAWKIIREVGLNADGIQTVNGVPTGTGQVTLGPGGVPEFRIEHPAAYDRMTLSDEVMNWALSFQPDWIYFGTIVESNSDVERFTAELVGRMPGVR